jgi:hypothetical protein
VVLAPRLVDADASCAWGASSVRSAPCTFDMEARGVGGTRLLSFLCLESVS